MTRIHAIDPAATAGQTRELLDSVKTKLGMTPNMMRTMANSPAVLEGYLNLNGALSRGLLEAKFREQLALTVAQANDCEYCLAAHTALGSAAGLAPSELAAARQGAGGNGKADAGLRFAQEVVRGRGRISGAALDQLRNAGFNDGEIAEIIAHVALNVFTNYFNVIARTEVDFPRV
jgi:uncharacterized peroxidase-related enzyme